MDLWNDLCWDLSTVDNDTVVHFCCFSSVLLSESILCKKIGCAAACTHASLCLWVGPVRPAGLWGVKDEPAELGSACPKEQYVQLQCSFSCRARPLPQPGKGSLRSSRLSSQFVHFFKQFQKGICSESGNTVSRAALQRVNSFWAVECFVLCKVCTIEINLKPINHCAKDVIKSLHTMITHNHPYWGSAWWPTSGKLHDLSVCYSPSLLCLNRRPDPQQ